MAPLLPQHQIVQAFERSSRLRDLVLSDIQAMLEADEDAAIVTAMWIGVLIGGVATLGDMLQCMVDGQRPTNDLRMVASCALTSALANTVHDHFPAYNNEGSVFTKGGSQQN